MTVRECYEQMGADYEGVLGRLRSEVLIKKFAKKFLDDGSFRSLKDNLAQKNGEEAFRAAHTLKGVCQNLGFDNLYKASFDITEKLRGRDTEGCEELLAKVEEQKTIKWNLQERLSQSRNLTMRCLERDFIICTSKWID